MIEKIAHEDATLWISRGLKGRLNICIIFAFIIPISEIPGIFVLFVKSKKIKAWNLVFLFEIPKLMNVLNNWFFKGVLFFLPSCLSYSAAFQCGDWALRSLPNKISLIPLIFCNSQMHFFLKIRNKRKYNRS